MILYTKKNKIPFQISAEDFLLVSGHTWHRSSSGYIQTNVRGGKKYVSRLLHHIIVGYFNRESKKEVDHINGDKRDNRRENLRVVSRSQNQANKKGHHVIKRGSKWEARLNSGGEYIYMGLFPTEEAASCAAIKKHKEIHGKNSYFNR